MFSFCCSMLVISTVGVLGGGARDKNRDVEGVVVAVEEAGFTIPRRSRGITELPTTRFDGIDSSLVDVR